MSTNDKSLFYNYFCCFQFHENTYTFKNNKNNNEKCTHNLPLS